MNAAVQKTSVNTRLMLERVLTPLSTPLTADAIKAAAEMTIMTIWVCKSTQTAGNRRLIPPLICKALSPSVVEMPVAVMTTVSTSTTFPTTPCARFLPMTGISVLLTSSFSPFRKEKYAMDSPNIP